jgi:hypothetical protein
MFNINHDTSLDEFLNESSIPNGEAATKADIGPVVLGILPCEDVMTGISVTYPSYVGVRFSLLFPTFPATIQNQIVATIWRLPPGEYDLELGILDFSQSLLASSCNEVQIKVPTIYTSLHRLTNTSIPMPGLFMLTARCNRNIAASIPWAIEEGIS